MSYVHIDTPVCKRCWNGEDSYGEICVHCGCCSKDPLERAKNRLRISKRHLQEQYEFDYWDKNQEGRKLQEKNIKSNIRYWKKRIKYYTKRIQNLKTKRR